jgi:quinoprotein glucose dehydrogenase
MRPLATLVAALLIALVPTAARAGDPDRWVDGLEEPVNMAWAPDGTLFVVEKDAGRVRLIEDGRLLAEPVVTIDVDVASEMGLLGIAVHPEWPDEPWLYLYYSDAADRRNRLIRIRIEDGNEVARETLLDGLATTSAYHNGGDLLFGADGMLYLSVGEGHQPDLAQDAASIGGKVLRMTETGGIPPDNPIEGSRAFTLGHRNSFGLCVDPERDELWETENGPTGGDEVNHLVPGANYGWPSGTGPLADARFTDPVAYYPEAIVPTGCAVWRGALYVASFGDGFVRRISLDGEAASRVHSFGEPVFDLAVGPDDRLYATTPGAIWRFGAPPEGGSPDEGTVRRVDRAVPWWAFALIGVAVALALLLTLRLAGRRRA